jgi:3',5'-cyclic AMP phosphodiesterase CpdA
MSVVRIAHLSDPHFGTIFPETERALLECMRNLRPSAVVLTGDITQRARRWQFLLAREFKEKLHPTPVHAVPGNHDIPLFNVLARVFAPYWSYEKYFHPQRESALLVDRLEIVALNSTCRWRHVQGSFRERDLRRKIRARDAGVRFRIAAFHHPLDCASPGDEKNLLRGGERILDLLEEKEFDLVLGGHIHDPHVSLSDTRYPNARRAIVLATAGTCLSWRTRLNACNSFHLLEVDTGPIVSLKITRHELHKSQAFQPGLSQFFRRDESGGWDYAEAGAEEAIEKGEENENQGAAHPG